MQQDGVKLQLADFLSVVTESAGWTAPTKEEAAKPAPATTVHLLQLLFAIPLLCACKS
jgi:hypothetical protein